jgi:hypothetical protein
MKRPLIAFLFAASLARGFAAPPAASLDAALDPSITLKYLVDAVQADGGSKIPRNKFFMVTGRIGATIDRTGDAEGAEFAAESELVSGEWKGLESVRSFRAYLRFSGKRFAYLADRDAEGWIKQGTLSVIIGSFAGTAKEYGSERTVPLIDVERIIPVE